MANLSYIPILISESENIHSEERRLLALYGLVLASIQGRHPHAGLFIHGQQHKTTTIKLNSNDRKIRQNLEEIKDIQKEVSAPPLILNNHCQICEFQQNCHQQAVDADNLSLLRGMTEKQMIIYSRRGIFTVAQLSHTYRARRNNHRKITPHRDLALQALAIREKRVYITEVPSLRRESVNIFLDIEGIPERQFDYLVGALICTPDSEIYYSFWADDPSEATTIFEGFLEILSSFEIFHVFHYGAYEVNYIKRMRETIVQQDGIIEKLLLNCTNVLSQIYGRIYFPVYSNPTTAHRLS